MISKLCSAVFVAGMAVVGAHAAVAKDIQFSGYTWHVRTGDGGPGPNSWSDSNVSVDDQGRLHVKISKRDGKWSCAEITSDKSFGFGRYEFDVDSCVANLGDNIVLGMFNYPTPNIGPDGTNEIDIEYATWGGVQPEPGNWTVWPAVPRVKHGTSAFSMSEAVLGSVNTFEWTSQSVSFDMSPTRLGSHTGIPDGLRHWVYKPEDYANAIPQHPEPVHINLWLFNGKPPTDDKEVEVIISRFTFAPVSPDDKN